MKKYLEDDDNKYFWEITLEDDLFMIRRGTTGSPGECDLTVQHPRRSTL